MVNGWTPLVRKDSERSWMKTYPITKVCSKRLIFRILKTGKTVSVELEDTLYGNKYPYTVRNLKDAEAIWKIIRGYKSFDQVVDRMATANYGFAFDKLDSVHEYDKLCELNKKKNKEG